MTLALVVATTGCGQATGGGGHPGGDAGAGDAAVGDAGVSDAGVSDAGVSDAGVSDAGSCVPAPEVCNGKDDDCDGVIDNGFDVGAACGVGVCAGGTKECTADGTGTVCSTMPGGSNDQSSAERCDGLDDDCDGVTDNGFDVGAACGVGACAGGTKECTADGTGTQCSTMPGGTNDKSTVEKCDGLDDDCDGVTDNGFNLGASCGVGVCAGGATECRADGTGTQCSTMPGGTNDQSSAEKCDGLDDDCDGVTDNGFTLGASCGVGACAGGATECNAAGTGTRCSTMPGGSADKSSPELCDGIDDNCNGVTDEGFNLGAACGGGACAGGVMECAPSGTSSQCSTMPGGSNDKSSPELCDGIDDNCNGQTDEGFNLGTSCGVGACAGGVMECAPSGTTSQCSTMTGGSNDSTSREVCDGIDNDCDGLTDEGCIMSPAAGAVVLRDQVGFSVNAPGATAPGNVSVSIDGVALPMAGGTVTIAGQAVTVSPAVLSGGQVTFVADDLPLGLRTLSTIYAGDGQQSTFTVGCPSSGACSGTPGATCQAGRCTLYPSNGSEGAFAPTASTTLTAGIHQFTTVSIPAGVVVRVTGNGVLDLRAVGDVQIDGTIDVSGGNGGPGAVIMCGTAGATGTGVAGATNPPSTACTGGGGGQGFNGGPGVVEVGQPSGGGAMGGGGGGCASPTCISGGGGGGGFSGGVGGSANGSFPGGAGGGSETGGGGTATSPSAGAGAPPPQGATALADVCYAGGQGAWVRGGDGVQGATSGGGGSIGADASVDLAMATTFRTGSSGGGGGSGGDDPGNAEDNGASGGGGGGGGGGALRIATTGNLVIAGQVLADGGAGGPTAPATDNQSTDTGGGGGGGSGGAIWLYARRIDVASGAQVSATGGSGGSVAGGMLLPGIYSGGAGGLGRIRITVGTETGAFTAAGQIDPPLPNGTAPGSAVCDAYVGAWPN